MPNTLTQTQAKSLKTAEIDAPPPALAGDGDNAIRWQPGERLSHLIAARCAEMGEAEAVVTESAVLSFRELDSRANQLARYLAGQGIGAGDRVGLLFDKSADTYVALLAVMKVNAGYVPLDGSYPLERMRFIAGDAGLKAIVSMSAFREKLAPLDLPRVLVDLAKPAIDMESSAPLGPDEVTPPADQLCYIIYTSGTTGNPKGVVIEHPSICNYVRVAAECYGFGPGDRVYQGMSLAFDFFVDEFWVPLLAGATVVAGKPGVSLVGEELSMFLRDQRVTCLGCCPTVLATIEQDLPDLRFLLLGGEVCPPNLVHRWHRPGLTIFNSYGPTETTVTATLIELTPTRPVTIGRPLPTYSVVILDPEKDKALLEGEVGEIGIAGIGLAAGYLNRDELTEKKFILDFLGVPNNPSKRIYRTGDLGRINADGEIEYLGRIDTQVKIRGYRIEMAEIESVLLEVPEIAQVAVSTFESEPGLVELVAYYTFKQSMSLPRADIAQALRGRLPPYMVPAFLEELPFIPMLVSSKADHKSLPKPKGPRLQVGNTAIEATTQTERLLAAALAETLQVAKVSVEDHFFDDLGAHSLLMARFCAKVRKNPAMAQVSMGDIYQNPTIAKLAAHVDEAMIEAVVTAKAEPFHVPSDLAYYGCGALQLLFYSAYALLDLWIASAGFSWSYAAIGNPLELYFRATVFAVATFFGLTALAIAAKWLLIGEWKAEKFPIWSFKYFRFWAVKTLVQSAPVVIFSGTPVYNLYLRLLGARIGRNSIISCQFVPLCTDLISIGNDSVLSKNSIVCGYKAESNFIHTGPISIGSNAFVGEASNLDINTAMGDNTQLGHSSSLQRAQRIPDGKRYHGSPAIETMADYCLVEPRHCPPLRRALYSAAELAGLLAVMLPILIMGANYLFLYFAAASELPISTWQLIYSMLLSSAGVFFGVLAARLVALYAVPRICRLFLKPDQTYPLFGLHHWLQRMVYVASNSEFYDLLFGDSSFIVHHMRWLGWNLNEVEQTGSNFGTNQHHDTPYLCEIGSGTIACDGLSMINMQLSSSSFRLSNTRIGDRNYLGNDIHYPSNGRTGVNCLLGTKVMIPIDGPVRENVGLLGSPCFEIPRMVEQDKQAISSLSEQERHRRIGRKNVHNFITACLFLLSNWTFLFLVFLIYDIGLRNYDRYGVLALFVASVSVLVAAVPYYALIERASMAFRRLTPKRSSVYEPYFWSHERYWKLSDSPIAELAPGTPFKSLILRLMGMKVGEKVYIGQCSITERPLTEIGDYANLNDGSVLQSHSLEEGVFKSDYIKIGNGCTLAHGAFVHYGVKMGDHAVLDPDSFLMKGEILEPHSRWRGNPAKLVRVNHAQEQLVGRTVAQTRSVDDLLDMNVAASVPAE